jgi:hypothetical protein
MNISQTKFANQIGISQQQISKYIASGVLEKVNEKGEVDFNKSMDTLRELGKIDSNGKFIKRDSIAQDDTSMLPFDGDVPYKSTANMTQEEIEAAEAAEKRAAQEALDRLAENANKIGTSLSKEQQDFIDTATMTEAKRKREAADAVTAELNVKSKEMEITRKQRDDEIRDGLYVLKTDIEAEAKEAGAAFLNAAMIAIDRASPRLIGKQSSHEIKAILKEQLSISLKGLIRE